MDTTYLGPSSSAKGLEAGAGRGLSSRSATASFPPDPKVGFGLSRESAGRSLQSRSTFAGVWFSDTGVMTRTEKRDEHWISGPHTGVIAVAGVVPILCCPDDLAKFRNAGDRVYLTMQPRPYLQSTIEDAGVNPKRRVCDAITGEYSHQQLAVGAVSMNPPAEGTDVRYGIPQFAPVVFSDGELDKLPVVKGAAHGPFATYNAELDGGFKVFGIGTENEIGEDPKVRERLFIGTFVARLGASGAMVNLGAALVHSA